MKTLVKFLQGEERPWPGEGQGEKKERRPPLRALVSKARDAREVLEMT